MPNQRALKPATALERAAGSPIASIGAAGLGAWLGDFAGLLPTLTDTLARGRQMARIEEAIRELDAALASMSVHMALLTDDQYKVLSEAAAAMYSTINEDKLHTLKTAAIRAVTHPEAVDGASDAIGRLLRDLSPAEVAFIVRYEGYTQLAIVDDQSEAPSAEVASIAVGTPDETVMVGLISLGLLYVRAMTWDHQLYSWSPLVPRLVILLRATD